MEEPSERSWQPVLWAVSALVFLDFVAVGFVGPQTPALVKELTPAPLDYIVVTGVLLAVGAALRFLCAPLMGVLSDCYGRRPILILSLAGLAAANLMRGFAGDLGVFLAGTIISGITSATTTVAFAIAADAAPRDKRVAAFGVLSAAIGAGFIVGPVFGGLAAAENIRGAFLAAAGISALGTALALVSLPETHRPQSRARFGWSRANPLAPLALLAHGSDTSRKVVAFFLLESALALFPGCFALFAAATFGWGPAHVGYGMGALAVVFVLAQGFLVTPAVKRLGTSGASMAALACGAAGFVALGIATGDAFVLLAMLGIGLSATAQPAIKAALSEEASPETQGELQGSLEAIGAISRVVSPALFGAVYALSANSSSVLLNGIPFLVTALILGAAVLLMRPQAKRLATPVAATPPER